jgi:7-cyano-7-deazaguanine synthase
MVPTETRQRHDRSLAVLVSGGLDSAILLGESLGVHDTVQPVYVREGLHWERAELEHLRRFLGALRSPALRPLKVLEQPVGDLMPGHWSVTGSDVPDAEAPDEAVFLPARNVLLLAKAMLWCHLEGVPRLALATLRSNPFPDATPDFFRAFQEVVNRGTRSRVEVVRPYGHLGKAEVMKRGAHLPLRLTISCIRPEEGGHCGRCNKCHERQEAFRKAGMADPTRYSHRA